MPRKRLTAKQLNRLLRYYAFRLVGAQRASDILYVRLLEGWLSRKEVAFLYDTVLGLPQDGAIAEVGTFKGKSTVAMARAIERSGREDFVYAIDPHEWGSWDDFQATVREAGAEKFVKPLKMKSADGAKWLAERQVKLKFLFLDGDHEEPGVVEDLEAFYPLMLPGAMIAMDDARPDGTFPGVWKAYERTIKSSCEEIGWFSGTFVIRKPMESTSS